MALARRRLRRWDRLITAVPLPGVESDYRVAKALGLPIREFQATTLVSEYVWWVALFQDEHERAQEALRKAERGR